MSDEIAIKVENLTKIYKLYNSPTDRLKESLHPFRKKYHHDFHALNDVSFEVKKGETVGIIGKNGSGKSTLLKLITGVLTPSSGSVTVKGKISALLELGAGFNPDLTGIENIYFNGTLMGFTRVDMDEKLDDILAFADIGEFAYQTVKTYSSGMFVRLAFAVAINVEPDVLIVDEALAVGDMRFQAKCLRKIEEKRENGVTILLVSHDTNSMRNYCTYAYMLDHGAIVNKGNVDEVCTYYHLNMRLQQLEEEKQAKKVISDAILPQDISNRSLRGEIMEVNLFDEEGKITECFLAGSVLTVSIIVKAFDYIANPTVAFMIRNIHGNNLLGVNTFYEKYPVKPMQKGEERSFKLKFKLSLFSGNYLTSTAFADQEAYDLVDSIEFITDKNIIQVNGDIRYYGLFIPESINIQDINQTYKLPEVYSEKKSGLCLYVGCGEDSREGFVGCDIRPLPNVAIVCKAWEVSKYCADVTEIFSRHMLEHLTLPQVQVTLRNWFESLAVGGKIHIIVPNIDEHIEQWKRAVWDEEAWSEKYSDARYAFAGLWGWQRESSPLETDQNSDTAFWDVHKSGFNKEFMSFLLGRIGFSQINCQIIDEMHLDARAVKTMDSGERQISPNLEGIRGDHRGRYEFAKNYVMKGDIVLDMASGVGYGAYILASQTECKKVFAVDLNEEAIEYGKKNYNSPKIEYIAGDCLVVELEPESFDLIISFETVEHICNDRLLLQRFHGLLKPQGKLLFSTPNQEKMPYSKVGFPFHVKHYTPLELECLLPEVGFEIEQRWTQHNNVSPKITEGWDGLFNIAICRKTINM